METIRNSNLLMRQFFVKGYFYLLSRLIRPVGNSTDRLTVKMGLKLSQIIGVDMKRQILITNVWVEQVCIYFYILKYYQFLKFLGCILYGQYMFFFTQEWLDYKLKWNPADYGNVRHLHVPSQHIWLPDIVLYNKYVLLFQLTGQIYHIGINEF